jgi:hypothetical protein
MGFFLRLVAVPRSTLRLRHTRPSSVYARRYCELARESGGAGYYAALSPSAAGSRGGKRRAAASPRMLGISGRFWLSEFRKSVFPRVCARVKPPSRLASRGGDFERTAACACIKRRY